MFLSKKTIMKKLFYIKLVVALLVMGAGCTKFSDNINVDPNVPTRVSNAQLLTYALNQLPAVIDAPSGLLYVQYWSEKPYTDVSRYAVVNYDFYSIYTEALENLQTILNTDKFDINEGSANNQKAVARILKAYFFWHMTDRWGDVPYFNALKAKENFAPAYDRQKDIYYDLMKELKEAVAQIDNGNNITGDVLYGGKMDSWKRFANSMRLLMALRLSKVDAAKGKQEFIDALNAGVFTDNSQNAVYVHLADAANQSYWYSVVNVLNRPWYWASKTLVDYMRPLNDPRLKIFADKNISGAYNGVPYGLDGNAVGAIPSASVSFIGVHVRAQNSPTYITTYAQVLLAIAEANKLNWLTGGDAEAKSKYEAAIQASVRQWNRLSFKTYDDGRDKQVEKVLYDANDTGDTTGLAAYLALPEVVYNGTEALKKIAYQRWLHLYMNGYEAWAEWRRTGFPVLTPAPDNGGLPIPRRQAYPVKEQNINGDNYRTAITAQPGLGGKDDLNGRVWWDQ